MEAVFWMLLYGQIGMSVFMGVAWFLYLRLNNAGIVDIFWAFGFSLLAGMYAFLGTGLPLRKIFITLMVGLASLRLTYYLLKRFLKEHPFEDARYTAMRTGNLAHDSQLFFGIFQLQGVLMVLLSLPFALSNLNASPTLHLLEVIAIVLWVLGFIGEALADNQLRHFKHNPENQGKVCCVGLWRYSRHPNYFFEWLMWCAYAVYALASPWGWVSLYCPLLMLFFLTQVTGIRATEAQALKSKGEAYALYQSQTSAFFPWVPHVDKRPVTQ